MKRRYNELFRKYREGLATEEERLFVEEELERFEALSEYLEEEFKAEKEIEEEMNHTKHSEEDVLDVERLVRKRLRTVMMKASILTLFFIGLLFFVLSPLVSSFYYNPMKNDLGTAEKDVSVDMAVLSELTMPEYTSSSVFAESDGYGKYTIRYSLMHLFSEASTPIEKKVVRGDVSETLNTSVGSESLFMTPEEIMRDEKTASIQKEDVREVLLNLSPKNYGSASVLFKRNLSMEELRKFEKKYENISIQWVAVDNGDDTGMGYGKTGFSPLGSKRSAYLLNDASLGSSYPGLHLLEWLVHAKTENVSGKSIEAKGYEKHYESLLRYSIDRKEEMSVLSERFKGTDFFSDNLNYIVQNGVETYGVLLEGTVKELQILLEDESIQWMELKDMKVMQP